MKELLISVFVAFITLYFLEGKLEVRERTHNMINLIAANIRKIIQSKQRICYPSPSKTKHGNDNFPRLDTFVIGVACTLGNRSDEQGNRGLKWYPDEARDGDCELATLGIRNSGRITDNRRGMHYFYFRFNSKLVESFRRHLIYIIVEYFDSAQTDENEERQYLGVAYDSIDGDNISAMFKPAGFIELTGDNKWKEAVFSLDDGNFTNRSNGADFRVCLRHVNFETKKELIVRRVVAIVSE